VEQKNAGSNLQLLAEWVREAGEISRQAAGVRKAVQRPLAAAEFAKWSDRKIARARAVSSEFAGNVRRSFFSEPSDTRDYRQSATLSLSLSMRIAGAVEAGPFTAEGRCGVMFVERWDGGCSVRRMRRLLLELLEPVEHDPEAGDRPGVASVLLEDDVLAVRMNAEEAFRRIEVEEGFGFTDGQL